MSCAEWHARDPSSSVKVLDKRPTKILVHHTATENSNAVGPEDLAVLARSIQDFHMDTNGWIDTGQHFTVNRGGLIAEGRHRSLETLLRGTSFIEGAHCPDQNDSSIGIENQGTYTAVRPPKALLSTLTVLLAYSCAQYRIEPTQIYGHRDFRDTACPGDKLYALLPQLRQQVSRLIGKPIDQRTAAPLTWPLLRSNDTGPAVEAAQHLLRNAGLTAVPADGTFGTSTTNAVMEFQRRHGFEQTGLIAGGSWPLLAVPVSPADPGEAGQAVRVLLAHYPVQAGSSSEADGTALPDPMTPATWQRLLGGVRT
jgi:N-acetyl-anhydromuramyl-L-alanine amidase AmpD